MARPSLRDFLIHRDRPSADKIVCPTFFLQLKPQAPNLQQKSAGTEVPALFLTLERGSD